MNVLQSASKIVFILLAASACVGFFLKILDPKDFMLLAGMAFSFYFANKGETNPVPTDNVGNSAVPPFAGK